MTTEKLYSAIQSAFKYDNVNLYGVWDKITYTAQILLCERMIESESYKNLPEIVCEYFAVENETATA